MARDFLKNAPFFGGAVCVAFGLVDVANHPGHAEGLELGVGGLIAGLTRSEGDIDPPVSTLLRRLAIEAGLAAVGVTLLLKSEVLGDPEYQDFGRVFIGGSVLSMTSDLSKLLRRSVSSNSSDLTV